MLIVRTATEHSAFAQEERHFEPAVVVELVGHEEHCRRCCCFAAGSVVWLKMKFIKKII